MSNCDWCESHTDEEEFIGDELLCIDCYQQEKGQNK